MPLNSTKEERTAAAIKDLAAKMKLEIPISRDLKKLFSVIISDMQNAIAQTGQPQNADLYFNDFTSILAKSYRATNSEFSGRILDFIEEEKDNTEEAIIAALLLLAGARNITIDILIEEMTIEIEVLSQTFIQINTTESSRLITNTNKKQMNEAVNEATRELAEKLGRQPTKKEVSAAASRKLKSKFASRIATIATTEVQKAAEGTKEIERTVFKNTRSSLTSLIIGLKPLTSKEFWVTMGDNRVRFSHVQANGSTKNENGVFVVQGQFLLHPGDTSLGATADNVQNCRCSAVTALVES